MVYTINSSSSMRINEKKVVKETQEETNIDLNLNLSLNGKFGVDPQKNHIASGTNSHPKVLVTTEENGAESKMCQSLDSQGSNSFNIQCIEGLQGNPANIECSNGDKTVAASKAKPVAADEVEGRVFNNADMPHVFTTVHGQKIEGFLSKYDQVENITIICACHGYSMSPAEFIKHAGGGDVANPFRHIRVNYARGGGNGANPLN